MKFISIDYYISGDSNQKYHKKDLSILHQKKRKESSKKYAGNNIKYTQRIHYGSS
jgi:hypothetical protein